MIVEPPLLAGGEKLTVACALPAVALTARGALGVPGGATGVTALEDAEGRPEPNALVAVTVKVYAVPLASPVTEIGDTVPVAVMPPGLDVAM